MKTVIVDRRSPSGNELIEQARMEPILLRDEDGRTFVLAEVDEADAEAMALADSVRLQQIIEHSRERAKREGWLTTEQIREQLGLS